MNLAQVTKGPSCRGQNEIDEEQKLVDIFVGLRDSDYKVEISIDNMTELIRRLAN
jgi:hypothetical protein